MAENGSGYVREVAHRVFAAELKESNLQSKEGQDQYSPQYLITPTVQNATASSSWARSQKKKMSGLTLNSGAVASLTPQALSM